MLLEQKTSADLFFSLLSTFPVSLSVHTFICLPLPIVPSETLIDFLWHLLGFFYLLPFPDPSLTLPFPSTFFSFLLICYLLNLSLLLLAHLHPPLLGYWHFGTAPHISSILTSVISSISAGDANALPSMSGQKDIANMTPTDVHPLRNERRGSQRCREHKKPYRHTKMETGGYCDAPNRSAVIKQLTALLKSQFTVHTSVYHRILCELRCDTHSPQNVSDLKAFFDPPPRSSSSPSPTTFRLLTSLPSMLVIGGLIVI